MAVVQISKIQIRRGLKSIGVPQLSSAELAWAVDTQELFIGNGSVAEGAPYVGNTKVLTENDNIIELASSYEFASTDPAIINTVSRPLGEKIDEIEVSVADFGAVGDGSTDNVEAFENAFEQLFRNTDTDYRKVLKVPNGTYLFLSSLEIPSNAIIRGETRNNTVLNIDQNNILFVTSEGESVNDFNGSNRPTSIEISNLTITRSSGQMVLTGVADSHFDNLVFRGEHVLSQSVSDLDVEPSAVIWNNTEFGTETTGISFKDCEFFANSIAIKCIQTSKFDSFVNIEDCKFELGHTGIYINGVAEQGNNWTITNTVFEEIGNNALRSMNGIGTKMIQCRFINCGNETNQASNPVHEIVYFNESRDNLILESQSNRIQQAAVVNNANTLAVTEVFNSDKVGLVDRNSADIFLSDSARTLAVFSADNKFIKIDYTLRLGNFSRSGTMFINVDNNKSSVNISDSYSYSSRSVEVLGSQPSSDPTFDINAEIGGPKMTNFEFLVSLADNNSDTVNDTVVLSYRNPLATGSDGSISFDVTYGV